MVAATLAGMGSQQGYPPPGIATDPRAPGQEN
jgi:hypothetical protein